MPNFLKQKIPIQRMEIFWRTSAVGADGIEPSTSFLSGMRSTTELRARMANRYCSKKYLPEQVFFFLQLQSCVVTPIADI